MTERIHPDDFLIAMVHYLPNKRKSFIESSEKFNKFLYQQKQSHPEILDSFMFNTNGHYPTSKELYQAITNMFGCGLIFAVSSMPNHYHFDSACEHSYQKFVKQRIPSERLSEIEEIAKAFDEPIATNIKIVLVRE